MAPSSCTLSREIIAETAGKLLGKPRLRARYGFDPVDVSEFRDVLAASARLSTNLPALSGAVPLDPKDDVILATAVAAGAGYLVTGDRRHLLSLGAYAGIRIVSPRAFLDLVRSD